MFSTIWKFDLGKCPIDLITSAIIEKPNLPSAAVELVEGLVGSALYDLALLDYEDLVGSADD